MQRKSDKAKHFTKTKFSTFKKSKNFGSYKQFYRKLLNFKEPKTKMSAGIKCDDFILKLDLDEPSEYAKLKAVEELRETKENIEEGLKTLRELLKGV